MRIHFSPWFSARPYIGREKNNIIFGEKIVGPSGLLQLLQEAAGIYYTSVQPQIRMAEYYRSMKSKIKRDDIFFNSFQVDPMGVSNQILKWRDILVKAGWDVKSSGRSKNERLDFIKRMETENLPLGEADMWFEVLQLAKDGAYKGGDIEIVSEVPQNFLPPFYRSLLNYIASSGIKVEYANEENITNIVEKALTDKRIELMQFPNEDQMMRYAILNSNNWDMVICPTLKRLGNNQQLLDKPVSSSSLSNSQPQILQLFTLGNGLFNYPCNIAALKGWLSAEKSPLKGLGWWLNRALTRSCGIYNEEWYDAIGEWEGRNEGEKSAEIIAKFLPMPESESMDVAQVLRFNEDLAAWAMKRMRTCNNEVEAEQYSILQANCTALCSILQEEGDTILPDSLSVYVSKIAASFGAKHTIAQTGSLNVIEDSADIYDIPENTIWLGIYDLQQDSYPFSFLSTSEYMELSEAGVGVYSMEENATYAKYSYLLPFIKTAGKIALAIPEKVMGKKPLPHPIVIQIENILGEDNFKEMFIVPELQENELIQLNESNFKSLLDENGLYLQLPTNIKLEKRKEESASSLEQLIQHPFDYVQKYCLGIEDEKIADLNNVRNVKGSVCHKFIEKIFMDGDSVRELADVKEMVKTPHILETYFEYSVDECGIVLRQPQFAIDLGALKENITGNIWKLVQIIEEDKLKIIGCEVSFSGISFVGDTTLRGSIDMLLEDPYGNPVIFDFKNTNSYSYYEDPLKCNQSVQFAVYKECIKQTYGKQARAAYIFLPKMIGASTDTFASKKIRHIVPVSNADAMDLVKNSYKFRWDELEKGKVECGEGLPAEGLLYYNSQDTGKLIPLKVKGEGRGRNKIYNKSENKFSDYKNLYK